ncbi:MAG: DMT family transporter [Flavobacteriales bacterium]
MNKRAIALLAATATSIIYGVNHTIAKNLMPEIIQPYGFILLRVGSAAILFWTLSLFFPNEKIDKKDRLRIIACGIFGMALNMLSFFKGLSLSTPINSSVVITLVPVMVLMLSAIILKEKITKLKFFGIGLGMIGALLLVIFGLKIQVNAPNIPLGNLLFMVNAASYSVYLVIVKPLVAKYSSITLMKWFFLVSLLINLPIGISEFTTVSWSQLPLSTHLKLAFVVIGTTFLTYLFNIFALKQLKPSTIGAFIYLQPMVAVFYAVVTGADHLTTLRIVSASLIFIGVYLTTLKSKKAL